MNLVFESKWDKALPNMDRQKIEQTFHYNVPAQPANNAITFTPLWQAINHQSALLVTVLINNYGEQAFSFHNTTLEYIEDNNKVTAIQTFSLNRVLVPPDSSMPWTFIFPKSSFTGETIPLNGSLVYHRANKA